MPRLFMFCNIFIYILKFSVNILDNNTSYPLIFIPEVLFTSNSYVKKLKLWSQLSFFSNFRLRNQIGNFDDQNGNFGNQIGKCGDQNGKFGDHGLETKMVILGTILVILENKMVILASNT
jgi:hypothetical protein